MRIDFKQLEFIHPKLRNILNWIELRGIDSNELVITSLYRIGDRGVHGQLPLRGCDLRSRDENIGRAIEAEINANWTYDPARLNLKCCVLHGEGYNRHIHIQVSNLTTIK